MKVAVLFLAVFILTQAFDYETEFTKWTQNNNKSYSAEEYQYRLGVFSANLDKIQQLNEESEGGAVFAVNKFADLTAEEFSGSFKGYVPKERTTYDILELPKVNAPTTFDWVPLGKTTPVKDQAQCGSCWAFSATENIESVWMIAKDITSSNFKPLAPQQIVDCDRNDGGCNGGDTPTAYEYIISAGGQDTEASYPYKAVNQACHFLPADVEVKISSYKYITKTRSEPDMVTATATVSPLSICVDAEPWQFYSGGIMKKAQCGTSLDHCVQITAYDTAAATPYWNVRNSWGTDWGEKGFIRLEYGTNTCGVAIEPTTAVV